MKVQSEIDDESEIYPHSVSDPDGSEDGPPGYGEVVFQLHGDEDGSGEEREELERQFEWGDPQPFRYLFQG